MERVGYLADGVGEPDPCRYEEEPERILDCGCESWEGEKRWKYKEQIICENCMEATINETAWSVLAHAMGAEEL